MFETPPEVLKEIETFKAVSGALATLGAATVVAIGGGLAAYFITGRIQRDRNEQDRESQWRSHAVELTKLEAERVFKTRRPGERVEPFIHVFLALYRDLSELGRVKSLGRSPTQQSRLIRERRTSRRDQVTVIGSDDIRATVVCPPEGDGEHPRIFLTVEREAVATCPYCSRVYVLGTLDWKPPPMLDDSDVLGPPHERPVTPQR